MAQDPAQSILSQFFSWQFVAAVVTALSFLYTPTTFRSHRPDAGGSTGPVLIHAENVGAQLWQDPFAAVSAHEAARLEAAKVRAALPNPHLAHWSEPSDPGRAAALQQLLREPVVTDPAGSATTARVPATTLLLPVFVEGRDLPDNSEFRLRARHAVASALAASHYVPERHASLGFVRAPWPSASELTAQLAPDPTSGAPAVAPRDHNFSQPSPHAPQPTGLIVAPYECFAPDGTGRSLFRRVIVLWLREEDFEDRPLHRLELLLQQHLGVPEPRPVTLAVHVIGPRSTPSLERVLLETATTLPPQFAASPAVAALGAPSSGVPPPRLTFFSPLATAPDAFFADPPAEAKGVFRPHLTGLGDAAGRRQAIIDRLARAGYGFVNVTCTDDELIQHIVRELALRGFDFLARERRASAPVPRILLLSEWDNSYARALPQAFRAALDRFTDVATINGTPLLAADFYGHTSPCPDQPQRARIDEVSYSTLVDGRAPQAKPPSSGPQSAASNLQPAAAPEGEHQLDYLTRLADRLAEEIASGPVDQPVAVGLFGSDVYDKLLILDALRPRLPRALFFTTDLDARLVRASQDSTTRNLIVASSFDLQLHHGWMEGTAPFRDSYQTAIFLATRLALDGLTPGQSIGPAFAEKLRPLMFEIGLHRPVRLPEPGERPLRGQALRADEDAVSHQRLIDRPVHPRAAARGLSAGERFALAGAFLLGVLFLVVSPLQTNERQRLLVWGGISFLVLIAALIGWKALLGWHPGGEGAVVLEPWAAFEGVSIWPSVLLRSAAAALAIGAMVALRRAFRCERELVEDAFSTLPASAVSPAGSAPGDETTSPAAPTVSWFQRVRSIVREFREILLGAIKYQGELFSQRRQRITPDRAGPTDAITETDLPAAHAYLRRASWQSRLLRSLLPLLVFIGFFWLLSLIVGQPQVPYRGRFSFIVERLTLFTAALSALWLTFLVADSCRLLRRLILRMLNPEQITDWSTAWQQSPHAPRHFRLGDLWLRVRFTGALTAAVGPRIYLPFVALLLLILARHPFIDAWSWPPLLVGVFALAFGVAIYSALTLQRAAAELRRRMLTALDGIEMHGLAAFGPGLQPSLTSAEVDATRRAIVDCREGAYMPLARQPLVGALLLPVGGTGLLRVLEQFAS